MKPQINRRAGRNSGHRHSRSSIFDISAYVNDGGYHNISAWYYTWDWIWMEAGSTSVSGCFPDYDFDNPRLDPPNDTGNPGVNPGSQNINWSVPLVGLPGRGLDEALHRRYNRWHSRFDQPDPYGGSYDVTDPQSLNRYSYVQNDPVNFVDPSGLCPEGTTPHTDPATGRTECVPGPSASVDVTPSRDDPFWNSFSASAGRPLIIDLTLIPAPLIPLLPVPQDTPERTDWNSCSEFVNYLVALAVGAVIKNSGSARITGAEIAASKLGHEWPPSRLATTMNTSATRSEISRLS